MVAMETNDSPEPNPRKPQTGFPRRFGIGSLLVFTALFAMLFGGLRTFNAHPIAYVAIAGFIVVIGLGQVLLFGGRQPREASLLVGGAVGLLWTVVLAVLAVVTGADHRPDEALTLLVVGIFSPPQFAICGYLVGCVIGGVFLVGDRINRKMNREE
jgi:hypothetical protein